MKQYPSIPYPGRKGLNKQLHTFAKLDGTNIRFEWNQRRGWYKFGTRHHLVDQSFPIYGPAVPLFHERLAEPLWRVIRAQQWERVVVFCEFHGPDSLGGQGDFTDLTLLDVNPHRKGFLPPVDFLKLFGEFGPHYLGYRRWTSEFIEQVRASTLEGASFEGVVGKCQEGGRIRMYKTKTEAWKAAILAQHGEQRGRKMINS